jgi:hypothetical protein
MKPAWAARLGLVGGSALAERLQLVMAAGDLRFLLASAAYPVAAGAGSPDTSVPYLSSHCVQWEQTFQQIRLSEQLLVDQAVRADPPDAARAVHPALPPSGYMPAAGPDGLTMISLRRARAPLLADRGRRRHRPSAGRTA